MLQRFKALVRLLSLLKRRATELNLPAAAHSVAPGGMRDTTWESAAAQEWVGQVLQVGECLALFGGADFTADPRVTAQHYVDLLQDFLEEHGAVLRKSFIAQLPYRLQDEANVTRALIKTWCKGHGINFGRLMGESSGQQEQQEQQEQQQQPDNLLPEYASWPVLRLRTLDGPKTAFVAPSMVEQVMREHGLAAAAPKRRGGDGGGGADPGEPSRDAAPRGSSHRRGCSGHG